MNGNLMLREVNDWARSHSHCVALLGVQGHKVGDCFLQ